MKVYLASMADLPEGARGITKNVSYVLESFYYFKEWETQLLETAKEFLLDSGAFTFLNSKKNITKEELEVYCDRYIDFINKYDIKLFFEMDVDALFGLDYVEYLRRKIESGTKKKCIPVWHENRGFEYWKKMCSEYDYVAIGGITPGVSQLKAKDKLKMIKLLTRYARARNVKVHGLGFTSLKELDNIPFYSVDSTSWKSGVRFGTMYTHDEGKLMTVKTPKGARVKSGNDWRIKVEMHNLSEWVKFQRHMDQKKW